MPESQNCLAFFAGSMTGTFIPGLEITGLTADGKAFGMFGDIKVFVDKGIPGDVADVQMKKSFHRDKALATGKILLLRKNSPQRIEPFCLHFKYCGGCQWQNISYADQLHNKQKQVAELFSRFSDKPEIFPVLPSPLQKNFRNRVTFTFSNRRWMSPEELEYARVTNNFDGIREAGGYVLKGNNDRIMNIEECFLSDDHAMTVMKALRKFAWDHQLSFYDVRHEKGFLRSLTLRFGSGNDAMAIVGFGNDDHENIQAVMNFLVKNFPQLISVYYSIHPWKDSRRSMEPNIHFSGKKFIEYNMEGLVFRAGPSSFFQTNTLQAIELYRTALSFAKLTGEETVYDLYSGTGTIALFVSRFARKVVGIESAAEAVSDARENADLNHVVNTTFLAGDIKDTIGSEVFSVHGAPDVIITDPPRSGMHREGIQKLAVCGAKRIVYISCNPVTQARDLRQLSSHYKIVQCQPVDMFPQTNHVENVALLEHI